MDQLTVLEESQGRWDFRLPMCFGYQIGEKNVR
jgi:hypothetical protein